MSLGAFKLSDLNGRWCKRQAAGSRYLPRPRPATCGGLSLTISVCSHSSRLSAQRSSRLLPRALSHTSTASRSPQSTPRPFQVPPPPARRPPIPSSPDAPPSPPFLCAFERHKVFVCPGSCTARVPSTACFVDIPRYSSDLGAYPAPSIIWLDSQFPFVALPVELPFCLLPGRDSTLCKSPHVVPPSVRALIHWTSV